MKITVVAPTEIPARRANTVQVMKMTQALADLGHTMTLLAPTSQPTGYLEWDELARHYGLHSEFPVQRLHADPRLHRYDYAYRAVRQARQLGADLLYTRLPQAAAFASISGVPTILEVHDMPQGRGGPWLLRRFLRGRGARRLVVITRALVDDLAARMGAPLPGSSAWPGFTVILADGVDLERFEHLPEPGQARQNLGLPDRFTAGYTGHLYAGRGIEILIQLAERLPEITLLLVGGELADVARLKSQLENRNLKNVVLTGFIANAELPIYQAACEVLLMPYQWQVAASSGGDIARYLSPMKLFEYMACGRATLSSDLPVLREVLTPENALLLPPDDPQAWATGLSELMADPERRNRLGKQARADAAAYTWESRAVRMLAGI